MATRSNGPPYSAERRTVRRAVTAIVMAAGLIVLALALSATHDWFDRHFLPSFLLPRHWYTALYTCVRWTMAFAGVLLVSGARAIGARASRRGVVMLLNVGIAALLALGASELVLRRRAGGLTGWLSAVEEPRRQADARLGWTLVPSRTAAMTSGGRSIQFAVDGHGYRVSGVTEPLDLERPTVLFAGESVMFGEGLTWTDTVPAQVGSLMNVQVANLAVHGFSTDQAYLRLRDELPRFKRPVAIVTLFMTALFGRNLNDDRPHLGPGLVWLPARSQSRLKSLAAFLVPYRREDSVERGIARTREVLRAIEALALARGATSLIVVPQFGDEEPIERRLRRRILDDSGLPYVFVRMDEGWRLPWNRHPDVRAAQAMATAIASRLDGTGQHSTDRRRGSAATRHPGVEAERPIAGDRSM
jgi:hypothetical protein